MEVGEVGVLICVGFGDGFGFVVAGFGVGCEDEVSDFDFGDGLLGAVSKEDDGRGCEAVCACAFALEPEPGSGRRGYGADCRLRVGVCGCLDIAARQVDQVS